MTRPGALVYRSYTMPYDIADSHTVQR
jgi:hypothetical protein